MLYEIPKELFKQFKDRKHVQKRTHLALQLPEIISHILSYLVIPYQYDEQKKIKFHQYLYPCLLVNSLWHDCATRLLWRHVTFEDTKAEFNAFNKLTDILSPSSSSSAVSPTTATGLAIQSPKDWPMDVDRELNEDPLFFEYQYIPSIQPNRRQHAHCQQYENKLFASHRRGLYRKSVRSLTLRKIKDKNINDPLQRMSQITNRLEKLDIYICDHVADATIKSFVRHTEFHLTYLSLAGCNRITDNAIMEVAQHCPKLEHLDLRACGLISDVSIESIANGCPQLHHLNVGRVRDREKVTMYSINQIAQKTRVAVLGLAGCDMTDECLIMLARLRGHELERISVNNCYRITNRTIRAYVKYCPHLSVFEMKECHRIDDWGSVADLVQRKVLLTLCDQQNRACAEWAKKTGRIMEVKAPVK